MDLNMVYYHIILSDNKTNLCIIILPWRKYRHKILTMGFIGALYILWVKTNKMFQGLEFICEFIYVPHIHIICHWMDLLEKLEITVNKLKKNKLKWNTKKSFFDQIEISYLIYWVTH